jgi:hypothetical protein
MTTAWVNPRHPLGMVTWGTLTIALISFGLWTIHGRAEELWPNRCQLLKSQLLDQPIYQVTFQDPPDDLSTSKTLSLPPQSWPLHLSNSSSIPISVARYTHLEIHHYIDPKAEVDLAIKLTAPTGVTVWGERKREPSNADSLKLLRYALGGAHVQEIELPRSSALRRMGYELTPIDLSCRREHLLPEVIQMVALLLKRSDESYQHVERWGMGGWSATVNEQGSSRRVYTSPIISSSKSSSSAQAASWMWVWSMSLMEPATRDPVQLERSPWLSQLEALLKGEAPTRINGERAPLSSALIRALEESLTVTLKEQ